MNCKKVNQIPKMNLSQLGMAIAEEAASVIPV